MNDCYTYDPLGDGISQLTLVDVLGDDQRVVQAARVSLAADLGPMDAERDAKLIRYLLRHGHWSPFEHSVLTVRVVAPLPIARQWMRHKSWSFNEVSRRYTSEDVQIYEPREWRAQGAGNRQASGDLVEYPALVRDTYHDAVALAQHVYTRLLALGVAREQARLVLPQAMYTTFYATACLRSVLHFISLRDAPGADADIQPYARCLGEMVAAQWPVTWAAYQTLREDPR